MKELIDSFSHIIDSHTVLKERENPKILELKIKIVFTDQSTLEYSEINVIQPPKSKYSFQIRGLCPHLKYIHKSESLTLNIWLRAIYLKASCFIIT